MPGRHVPVLDGPYTPTLTRLLLHAYSYKPTLTRLLLHAYSYTPHLTRLLLHASSYTPVQGACRADTCRCLMVAAAAETEEARELGVSLYECGPACRCHYLYFCTSKASTFVPLMQGWDGGVARTGCLLV